MTEEPRPQELSRRVDEVRDEMREGFRGVNGRLDKVPTNDLLIVHLDRWSNEQAQMREDLKSIVAGHAHDMAGVDTRHESHVSRTDARFEDLRKEHIGTRRFVITTAIATLGGFVGLLTLILNQVAK